MRHRIALLLLILTPLSFTDAGERARYSRPGPVQLDREGVRWAEKTLRGMSVEQKVGQLLMVRALAEFQNTQSAEFLRLQDEIRRFHIGSVIITVRTEGGYLVCNQPYEAAMVLNRLQRESVLPLLVAADFERGLSMRLLSTPYFPHAMAFGATGNPGYAEQFGRVVARESRAIGVHWNFFPVADINSNPLNPIINIRAFGEDPDQVSGLLEAYIRGARDFGMLTTAKHFPGHGDTDTDSHIHPARLGASLDRIQKVELVPFQKAIAAGVDSVMVAHVTVPALESDPKRVATVSAKVVQGLLREKLGFAGLIVTDAMDMKALTALYDNGDPIAGSARAAVDAIRAGNDLVLLPANLEGAFTGLVEAVRTGVIPVAELDRRVRRVLQAKAALGLHKARLVDVEAIATDVGKPEDMRLAEEIAQAAITLVRDNGQSLPALQAERKREYLDGTLVPAQAYDIERPAVGGTVALILTSDVRAETGRNFERELRSRIPDVQVFYVDRRLAGVMTEPVTAAVLEARVVVIAAYATPSAGRRVQAGESNRASRSVANDTMALMDRVIKVAGPKTALLAMGNPYMASDVPGVETLVCTYSSAPTSEAAVVRAIFGEAAIRGRLPVTLPEVAKRGAGLDRGTAARQATAGGGTSGPSRQQR